MTNGTLRQQSSINFDQRKVKPRRLTFKARKLASTFDQLQVRPPSRWRGADRQRERKGEENREDVGTYERNTGWGRRGRNGV